MKPIDIEFRVAASPLVDIFDNDRRLLRFLDNDLFKILSVSDTSVEFRDLVNKHLRELQYPVPIQAVFVDGLEGYETDYPEFVRVPVLMICPRDATGQLYPTKH